jgi:ADP-ribosylglycohydrolase
MIKTSINNPLRIDGVEIPSSKGLIGMTICPGKKDVDSYSGDHDRDLGADLAVIESWGAEILVSLIQPQEYALLGVESMPDRIPAGMLHLLLPIPDYSTPDAWWEKQWIKERRYIHAVLRRGGKVCIHCKGGLGRSGLVAARILVESGIHPSAAIKIVRKARPGAVETKEQEGFVESLSPIWHLHDRFRGCLLAGAAGDALGATVEFMSREAILNTFGVSGIRDFIKNQYGSPGKVTDDTQMTLFSAEGLIRAEVRSRLRGLPSYVQCIGSAYLRWLHTQGYSSKSEELRLDGWLLSHRDLLHARGPGSTCLRALQDAKGFGVPEKARNDSKGCGGVMRAAPFGLFAFTLPETQAGRREFAFTMGCNSAMLTHGHPSGYLSAGALALMVLELVSGRTMPEALAIAMLHLQGHEGSEELIEILEKAKTLADSKEPADVCLAHLGLGWVGEEALAIAVFCALRAPTLEEGIIMAVNIEGDSDSTGSIAGNLLGAWHGLVAIPDRWASKLELNNTIPEIADDLLHIRDALFANSSIASPSSTNENIARLSLEKKDKTWWSHKYPGW